MHKSGISTKDRALFYQIYIKMAVKVQHEMSRKSGIAKLSLARSLYELFFSLHIFQAFKYVQLVCPRDITQ